MSTETERVGRAVYVLLMARGMGMFDRLARMPLWQRVEAVKMYCKYGDAPVPDEMAISLIADPAIIRDLIAADPVMAVRWQLLGLRARAEADQMGIIETLNLMADALNMNGAV